MGLTIYILLAIILVSKELYIVTEETLILATFISFIGLTYNLLSSLITSELDSRTEQLSNEFVSLYSIKEKSLMLLLKGHRIQLELHKQILQFMMHVNSKIIQSVELKQKKLRKLLTNQQSQKLNSILKKETNIILEFRNNTTNSFSKIISQTIALEPKEIIRSSIEMLENLNDYPDDLNDIRHLSICNNVCGVSLDILYAIYFIKNARTT